MAYDPTWTRPGGWKVTNPGDNNPWDLLKDDKLTFHGDGNGGSDDVVKRGTDQIASACDYESSDDSVVVTHDLTGTEYIIQRNGAKLKCEPKESGNLSWEATEG